jgi:hypothetical protein
MRFSIYDRFDDFIECHKEDFYPDRIRVGPLKIFDDTWYRFLNDNIHQWMLDFDIDYNILYEFNEDPRGKWFIDIPKKDSAMLFKITWL